MTSVKAIALVAGLLFTGTVAYGASAASAAQPVTVGHTAPTFVYHLLDGRHLEASDLRGHPYVLWMVASWCSSCQTGSNVVATHLDFLQTHGVRIVEMRLAKDLGAPGPGLQTFQKAVGAKANSPNWYWGELTDARTTTLDPKGAPDIYYLVDARGTIVAVDGNPAATWDTIERFAMNAKSTSANL